MHLTPKWFAAAALLAVTGGCASAPSAPNRFLGSSTVSPSSPSHSSSAEGVPAVSTSAAPVAATTAPVAVTTARAAPVTAAVVTTAAKILPPVAVTTSKAAAPPPAAPPVVAAPPAAKSYANCAALNVDYPHGVGRAGAVDHVSGSTAPVTTFTVNDAVYNANSGSDRDKDGIACEKL